MDARNRRSDRRRSGVRGTCVLVTAVVAAVLAFAGNPALAQEQTERGDVVLVHGAWADASSWSDVVQRLEEAGYDVTAPQFPLLASLEDNMQLLREVLAVQDGPVLLVAHAHGGILTSMLSPEEADIAGLAHIAGFAPDEGESLEALLADEPPVPSVEDVELAEEGFAWLPRSDFSPDPESDVDPTEAYLAHVAGQPLFQGARDRTMGTPAWASLPSWYLITTEDEVVAPSVQRRFAERMQAAVLELGANHLPMVSRPDEVAEFIRMAGDEAFAGD